MCQLSADLSSWGYDSLYSSSNRFFESRNVSQLSTVSVCLLISDVKSVGATVRTKLGFQV